MESSVVFIYWIIYKIILKIMEFNSNGALIDFYQARVWKNIVNKHINFVFSAIWLVLLIFPSFWWQPWVGQYVGLIT